MQTWLLRGTVLAVVHATANTVVALLRAHNPTGQTTTAALTLGLLAATAAVWAAVDAWKDVPDRGRTWVLACLIAGFASAILGVTARALFVDETSTSALGSALTGGAAFTALLVLIPAALGLLIGPHLDRSTAR